MRVKSPIADIDFVIGSIRRDGDALVISGDPDASMIDVEVRMPPADVLHMLRVVFFSPTAIGYFLSLPFLLIGKPRQSKSARPGDADQFSSLNNPWQA